VVRYAILLKFKPGTTDERTTVMLEGTEAMVSKQRGVVSNSLGRDLGLRDTAVSFGAVIDFEDENAYFASTPSRSTIDSVVRCWPQSWNVPSCVTFACKNVRRAVVPPCRQSQRSRPRDLLMRRETLAKAVFTWQAPSSGLPLRQRIPSS